MIKVNTRWVRTVIRVDAGYFLSFSYITLEEHTKVKEWLQGSGGKEAQEMIVKWLLADADYADRMNPATCRMVWFIWPFMWLALKVMAWNLRKYAEQLKGGEGSQPYHD